MKLGRVSEHARTTVSSTYDPDEDVDVESVDRRDELGGHDVDDLFQFVLRVLQVGRVIGEDLESVFGEDESQLDDAVQHQTRQHFHVGPVDKLAEQPEGHFRGQ